MVMMMMGAARFSLQIVLRVDAFRTTLVPQTGTTHVQLHRVAVATPPRAEDALQRAAERLPEVPIEIRIDERIEGGIEVANPEQDGNDNVRTGAQLFAAQRHRDIPVNMTKVMRIF